MARMSRKQYELLTEALGHGLYQVRRDMPDQGEAAAWAIITELALSLEADNRNFNKQEFVEGIDSVAKLDALSEKPDGLTLH